MSFLKDDQVIQLRMTPEGRKKLANGVFKPSMFSFGDSDLIYSQSNITENSTKVHGRLKDSLRLETQVEYGEKRHNENLSLLGNISTKQQETPYFELTVRNAETELITYSQSNVLYQHYKTPQVNFKDIRSYVKSEKEDYGLSLNSEDGSEIEQSDFIEQTKDGYRFYIDSEGFEVDLKEWNADGDFEIELYEVLTDSDGVEKLEAVEFEKEGGTYFSSFFNIQVDIERVPQTTQEDTSIAELYDFEELEEC